MVRNTSGLYRQPADGRINGGGVHLGEMEMRQPANGGGLQYNTGGMSLGEIERDAMQAHGVGLRLGETKSDTA